MKRASLHQPHLFALVRFLAATACAATASAQPQCTPHWETFPGGDLTGGEVRALASFPSGSSSPLLFAGGAFNAAGGVPIFRIAAWNGAHWSGLAGGMPGLSPVVEALVEFDEDGAGPAPLALYVAGTFTDAGGVSANRIARWNGAAWTALGSGTNAAVHALCVFDEDGGGPLPAALFAGGDFALAGGSSAAGIARWDGASWSAVLAGTNASVNALTVFDDDGAGPNGPRLIAGGTFTSAGGVPANRVASWDGAAWNALGVGTSGSVLALNVFDADGVGPLLARLFAGGSFSAAGGSSASNIASFDGSTWVALGSGTSLMVRALSVFDEDGAGPGTPGLYAGGDFTLAGGIAASRIARWSGSSWSALTSGVSGVPARVYALCVHDEDGPGPESALLCIGGLFTNAGGLAVSGIARWDGSAWSAFGTGMNKDVYASTVFDEDGALPGAPALFVGGDFTGAGGTSANRIARWDGTSFSPLGSGTSGFVTALTVFDDDGPGPNAPALYAGGVFTLAGGVAANRIARWNGSSFAPLGSGMNGSVLDLAVFDDDGAGPNLPGLIAVGLFTSAGGTSANRVARWNGSSWSALGAGVSGVARAAVVLDDDASGPNPSALYIGGDFTSAGGLAANRIARWDGSSWSALGSGTNQAVYVLTVFDGDGLGPLAPALIAGGIFSSAGGSAAATIARWDGIAWSALGSGTNSDVVGLGTFDEDGTGPNPAVLFAGGGFTFAGGIFSEGVARWNGSSWSALGSGTNFSVLAMSVFDGDDAGPSPPALYLGGSYVLADGSPSAYLARWSGCGSLITAFCPGDDTLAPCPCANSGASGNGCENSAGTGGALLASSGHASLAQDTLILSASGELPTALSIFLQGSASIAPAIFGDGLRCIGGSLSRLYVKNASGGVVSAPTGSEPSCSARSSALGDPIVPGAARYYQTYYRDPDLTFCPTPPGNSWNVSGGIAVSWTH